MSRPAISAGLIAVVTLLLISLSGCTQHDRVDFDIPEGNAAETFIEFARQARVEIIFDPETVRDLKTQPVAGRMKPVDALELMISEKRFFIHQDNLSNAIAIKKSRLMIR